MFEKYKINVKMSFSYSFGIFENIHIFVGLRSNATRFYSVLKLDGLRDVSDTWN